VLIPSFGETASHALAGDFGREALLEAASSSSDRTGRSSEPIHTISLGETAWD